MINAVCKVTKVFPLLANFDHLSNIAKRHCCVLRSFQNYTDISNIHFQKIGKVVSRYRSSNLTEVTLQHKCSPVNLSNIFRTHFTKNTSGWLLLKINFSSIFAEFRRILPFWFIVIFNIFSSFL